MRTRISATQVFDGLEQRLSELARIHCGRIIFDLFFPALEHQFRYWNNQYFDRCLMPHEVPFIIAEVHDFLREWLGDSYSWQPLVEAVLQKQLSLCTIDFNIHPEWKVEDWIKLYGDSLSVEIQNTYSLYVKSLSKA